MRQQSNRRGSVQRSSVIERLEDRRLMSASVATFSGVTPGKVLAGTTTAYETVTVHNFTTAPVTETVTVTVTPSLDGTTAAGAFASPVTIQGVNIKKKGTAKVKVSFVPPTTLVAGKYKTLVSVTVADGTDPGVIVFGVAPGSYKLTLPPAPTTTPSLVGHYTGLIYSSQTTGGGGLFGGGSTTKVKELSFIWETTSQDLSSLTGLFAVGEQQTTATMTGAELNTGAVTYTLVSDDINYTLKGTVSAGGSIIKGTIKATLVDNLFSTINGTFKLTRQAS